MKVRRVHEPRRFRLQVMPGSVLGAILVVTALVACTARPIGVTPRPTWPVEPEQLPRAVLGAAETDVTCDGMTFPASGLDAPPGAEKASGPVYDAMRAAVVQFADAFPGSATWTWRLAALTNTEAMFLAKTNPEPPAWVSIHARNDANGWYASGMGECRPLVVISAEFGPATWALDPAFAAPNATTTDLHILVWEMACSSGAPATGRMSAPVVQFTDATVTVTIGVRPLDVAPGGGFTCPMPPGTPATMQLPQPLGSRTLLDGGSVPPVPPSPANG